MQIIETNLSFGAMSTRKSTKRIILHHAEATSCTAEQIHQWHKARGWSGAGYHFLVRKDGNVYRLRPEGKVGAHASGNNSDSIGICFEGSYMKETMGDAQIQAGHELIEYLMTRYGNLSVIKHKDVCNTDCPGTNFPFDSIVSGIAGTMATRNAASTATVETASGLTVDGKIGPATVKALQAKLGTAVDGRISGQYAKYKKYWTSIVGTACYWSNGTSEAVKALQNWADCVVDGILGQNTAKAVQSALIALGYDCGSTGVDGYFGINSAKALQRWLND